MVSAPTSSPQAASVDYLIKIPPIEGDSGKAPAAPEKKIENGNTNTQGTSKDDKHKGEIEILSNSAQPQEQATNFGLLLGGSGDATEADVERARGLFVAEAKAANAALEQIAFNFDRINAKVRHTVKLFGFIPLSLTSDVEVDTKGQASAHLPWWAFLTSGSDGQALAEQTAQSLLSVSKKHEALTDGLLIIRY